jgi:hypothetical protein
MIYCTYKGFFYKYYFHFHENNYHVSSAKTRGLDTEAC